MRTSAFPDGTESSSLGRLLISSTMCRPETMTTHWSRIPATLNAELGYWNVAPRNMKTQEHYPTIKESAPFYNPPGGSP